MTRLVLAAALAACSIVLAPPAAAEGCQGYSGSLFANSTCDSYPYPDGSFDRCTSTNVFGFYSYQCVRIGP